MFVVVVVALVLLVVDLVVGVVAVAVAVVSTLAVFPAEGEPSAGTTPKVTRTLHAL